MGEPAKPVRRRIVPQQILSPTKSHYDADASQPAAAASQQQVEIGDLKEHSELATTLLGPGRKIYIDLAKFQREQKPVDWKELLKERGVKPDRTKDAKPDEAGQNENRFTAPARGEACNPLARVIQKLERAHVGMNNIPGDGDESDEDSIPSNTRPAGSDSEAEGDGEGEADADVDIDGNRTEGEGGKTGKPGDPKGAQRGPKRIGGDDYDYMDDFIDDSEFIEMVEHTDKRKLKYDGFFIALGSIDRSEELIPGAEPPKPSRKRKAGGQGGVPGSTSDLEKLKNGGANGDDPAKKKQKKKKVDGEASAASGSAPGAVKKPKIEPPPYDMPADVAAAIEHLRALAAAAPPPPPVPVGEDAKGHRKYLPPAVLEHLKVVEVLFQRDHAAFKGSAAPRILDDLMSFLSPFSTKDNMRLYVCGRPARKPPVPKPAQQSPSDLRALLARTVPPAAPPTAPAIGSDDDFVQPISTFQQQQQPFNGLQPPIGGVPNDSTGAGAKPSAPKLWKGVPMATRKALYAYMRPSIGDADLRSAEVQGVLQEVLGLFEPGTMDIGSLRTIYQQQRKKEQQAAGTGTGGGGSAGTSPPGTGTGPTPVTAPGPINMPPGSGTNTATGTGVPAFGTTASGIPPSGAAAGAVPQVQVPAAVAPAMVPQPQVAAPAPAGLAAAAIAAALAAATGGAQAQAQAPAMATLPGTAVPSVSPAAQLQQQAAAAVVPSPVPAPAQAAAPLAAPPSAADAGVAAPSQQQQQQQQQQPAATTTTSPPQSKPSNEKFIALGVSHGADQAFLTELLSSPEVSNSMYSAALLRILAAVGPNGATVSDIAAQAVAMGLETWDPTASTVKSGLSRKTKHEAVAMLAGYKYALRCFPGVVDTRPPKPLANKSAAGGDAGGGGEGAAAT